MKSSRSWEFLKRRGLLVSDDFKETITPYPLAFFLQAKEGGRVIDMFEESFR
jgi:hypothetical protein